MTNDPMKETASRAATKPAAGDSLPSASNGVEKPGSTGLKMVAHGDDGAVLQKSPEQKIFDFEADHLQRFAIDGVGLSQDCDAALDAE